MFERETSREIAAIYHNGLLTNPSIESMRRTDYPYHEKFLKAFEVISPNVFGVRCGGCEPITQDDWLPGESVPNTKESQFFGAYKKELKYKNYACFSRCGDEDLPCIKHDGRIDIRLLKINELFKYVSIRPTDLIKKDRDNLIKTDSKNKELYQRLFNDILIPISEQQHD